MLSSNSTGIETSSRQIPLQEGLTFYIFNAELSGTSLHGALLICLIPAFENLHLLTSSWAFQSGRSLQGEDGL